MNRTLTTKNVFGIVILSVFSALVVGTVIASVGFIYHPENDNQVTNFLALFIGQGFMIVPLLLFLIARKESLVDRLRLQRLSLPIVLATLVLSFGIIIAVDEFDRIASLLFTPPEYLDQLGYMLKFDSFNMAIFLIFGIVILAPLGEDGTGTWHEFEDGRAERVSTATSASGATASSSDWNTYSDSNTYLAGVAQGSASIIETTTAFTDNGFDPGAWDGYRSVSISGSSDHFRMMSSPVAGEIYGDLLDELWTQGMTGADATSGVANVWNFDLANQSFTSDPIEDISSSGESLTAGQGFLVHVFTDTNFDGDDDLPVTLTVSGIENNGNVTVPSSGSIDNDAWALAGNPYASTIDWDLVTQTAVTTSAYVWDSQASTPAYISWNGSSGSLTGGLIAPYQGFWVQGDGGSGSITIAEADKSNSAGPFYRTMNDSTGSMSFAISSGDYSNQTYVSFMNNGQEGIDNSDAYKLLPMSPSERVVGVSYAEGNGLDINNLPYIHDGAIDIPLDIMYLTVDADYNFVTNENEVTMNWDLSSLPETIIGLTLTNNTTGETTDLLQTDEVTFTTQSKGSFPAYGSNGVNIYPEVGESQFTLTAAYSALSAADEATNVPKEFALHPAYPNPFNPSTTIRFDLPEEGFVSMSVYDITGKLVETLVNEILPTGNHSIQWNPVNLSSGLYIVQLKAGETVFNQKITFIK